MLRAADWMRRESEYLEAERPAAGERFREAMEEAQRLLSEHPRAGAPAAVPRSRILVKGDYLISHRILPARGRTQGEIVEIFAVRHGRQRDARRPHR